MTWKLYTPTKVKRNAVIPIPQGMLPFSGVGTVTPIYRIISGGQTGVDQGALFAAKEAGILTGGCMPRHYRTEDGDRREFASMGLTEHFSHEYWPRTIENVKNSDTTIILTRREGSDSKGIKLTQRTCARYKKPHIVLYVNESRKKIVRRLKTFIELTLPALLNGNTIHTGGLTINFAGPRESMAPGIQKQTQLIVTSLLGAEK